MPAERHQHPSSLRNAHMEARTPGWMFQEPEWGAEASLSNPPVQSFMQSSDTHLQSKNEAPYPDIDKTPNNWVKMVEDTKQQLMDISEELKREDAELPQRIAAFSRNVDELQAMSQLQIRELDQIRKVLTHREAVGAEEWHINEGIQQGQKNAYQVNRYEQLPDGYTPGVQDLGRQTIDNTYGEGSRDHRQGVRQAGNGTASAAYPYPYPY
ncbi:hypothetical protein EVG20_g1924 [Dentipellis fragilis]|uniref:Uncharacterized protein n=1 Tax=Dentipellis fragilis TaxID=205917 RepID=A0A4Y9Z9E7_9AGAM|nr:hypothetical protein EVG20_g1924 [Dentipellis fragilis]